MRVVWRPDEKRAVTSNTFRFMDRWGIASYQELVGRSVSDPEWFWDAVVEFLGVPFRVGYRAVRDTSEGKPWTRWFVDGRVNLSEVCVDRWAVERPDGLAVAAESEDGRIRRVSFAELKDLVGRVAGGLRRMGVERGDAVAVFLPMSVEAVVSFLAVARLGAIFVPIFSGFGAEAVAARLEDPVPKVLICADGFTRRGRLVAMKELADQAIGWVVGTGGGQPPGRVVGTGGGQPPGRVVGTGGGQPPGRVGARPRVVVVDHAGRGDVPWNPEWDVRWSELLEADPVEAVAAGSEDPVMIAYTSGTTGRPKGAVHVHGGFTVKVAQEGAFQADLHPGDVLMWATDMGWIMGPWMVVAGLANGAAVVAYDGAPDHPHPGRLWELVERHRITFLGLSPTLIRASRSHGLDPVRAYDLSSLKGFGSTGEPLNPEPWWWLFREVGGGRLPIINISGGTEVGACILSVNILQGIKPSSLGGPALGMAADVYDPSGRPVRGEVGELVVTEPWPGMTRGFWGEPDRYLETYWSRWPDVWVHGDWASIDADGFWYLHGRSDDTLNVAGKRIGPAEIESAAVSVPGVLMAAAVGIPHPIKGEQVVVYAVPAGSPDSDLAERVAGAVVEALGKAFRPAAVHLVPDLPRTRSAKIMRRVIRALALGRPPGDLSSLENPQSLEHFGPL